MESTQHRINTSTPSCAISADLADTVGATPPPNIQPASDGSLSDVAPSEGIQTAMTSVAGSDDGSELVDSNNALRKVARGASVPSFDTRTLYSPREFGRPPSGHGTVYTSYNGRAYSDNCSSTRSLWARELDYREIHGRNYCKNYYMPNDEMEQLRLTVQHEVFMQTFNGEVAFAPVANPTHVLDLGTGTGEWAIRFAELHPDCEVVGTDISAIQETCGIPMNLFFEIEDAEEWDRPTEHYDLVNMRCLEGAFRDWTSIYKNVYDSLKPGGWVQVADLDGKEGSYTFFSGFPPDAPAFRIIQDLFVGAEKSGRHRGIFHLEPCYFEEAGFVDIQIAEHKFRMNLNDGGVGKLWLMTWLDGLEAYCLRTLTEYMGWDPDVVKMNVRETARQIADFAQNKEACKTMVFKMRIVLARKPSSPGSPVPSQPSGESAM
ncbi:hypothetical protein QQS21_009778 [Conoideocrella luteorostrata]|uniref:S-adenosyl-L-methionine-dependent methyltransferase n=1 Tax=Conoideocrella luteorostrata TaxID=1105319 RepID=A0AAJ0CIM8_9HYPO|nr:hypothetical protein QQS21_009778 [Conoideocrella luteorostrata]